MILGVMHRRRPSDYMLNGDRKLWGLILGSVALITGGLASAATPEIGEDYSHAR